MATVETPSAAPDSDSFPVLPRPVTAGGRSSESVRDLRRFHFALPSTEREPPEGDFSPAVLSAADFAVRGYPVFLGPPAEGASCVPLPDLVTRVLKDAEPGTLLADLSRAAAGETEPLDARELLGRISHEDAKALAEAVPTGGRFLPWSEEAPVYLLRHAAASRVLGARAAFREEVRAVAGQARDRLPAAGEDASAPSGAALGAMGNRFIDPSALTDILHKKKEEEEGVGNERLSEDLGVLEDYLGQEETPELFLVRHGGRELDEAAETFDREAESIARVVRALRRLRLAMSGNYEPARHDPWIDQLDWQGFSREELRVLPAVAALVAADEVAGHQMPALSHLLLSGRPVQVIVTAEPGKNPGAEPFAGFRFEPAYLGLSHREVLVQQTAAAHPAHMMRGFLRAVDATHAGLHVISASAHDLRAIEARAHPLFHFDPEAGDDWADRLDFSFNPAPEDDWPVHDLRVRKEAGGEDVLRLAFTFADFALTEPAYGAHFRLVPDDVPEAELSPMGEFCAASTEKEPSAIPFVWAVDGDSRLRRLAVSRPLALACRDRLDFWRTLQGVAGVRSEHVRRAAEASRRDVEARALEERQRLERLHAEELERLRENAARDVVDRLTSALLEVDVSTLVTEPSAREAPFSLAGFGGKSVDDVTAALLRVVDPATLDREDSEPGDERVSRMASELMRAL